MATMMGLSRSRSSDDWLKDYENSLSLGQQYNNINRRYGVSTSSGNYGTGASNSNSAFSWNNQGMQQGMWQQAKDMASLQLDNTLKTMGAASGYRRQELNLGDEITRRQADQQFGFQKRLSDDNYAFQNTQRAERERQQDEELERTYQMRRETTNSARQAASSAFFGGGNRFNARG